MSFALILTIVVCIVVCVAVFVFTSRRPSSQPERRRDPSESEKAAASAALPTAASLHDSVTSLYNRKYLLTRLKDVIARCDDKKERAALILWDIDGFVNFNNQYGQNAGDQFLRKVGETIRRSLRVYDEAFRSGSDEFCAILLPGDEEKANEVTRRVSDIVAKSLFEGKAEYSEHRFSISAGVVFYPSPHNVPEALLYAAGEALYKARGGTPPFRPKSS